MAAGYGTGDINWDQFLPGFVNQGKSAEGEERGAVWQLSGGGVGGVRASLEAGGLQVTWCFLCEVAKFTWRGSMHLKEVKLGLGE